MNSVERVFHYADDSEQEAPHHIEGSKPPPTWPAEGRMEFNDIQLAYRPGLPPVFKGLTMHVAGGEKIGIVDRTGAGKSSIMVALYHLVELTIGSITMDGLDTSKLGLVDLRQSISIMPYGFLLSPETLRNSLDPFGVYDDAFLWDALKRSFLIDSGSELQADILSTEKDVGSSGALGLHTTIEDHGGNLSFGQRSLASLAPAMVKNSKVLVLGEATDRLHTYDRICILDAGKIAELDSPINLYAKNGIFRFMCDKSSISLEDITAARNRNKLTD
ncbi:P-loop containing nucleoside triphosphate hydrolase protein [Mycena vulgaris]|nr:P-loop containing nucleoside triphosphate hydrolase protein [Mycena vulgaris]